MNRFENGFDSYKKAIMGLKRKDIDEYALKEIIVNFHHAIEVLFKHILSQKDRSLIYREVSKWIDYKFDKRLGINKENNSEIEYTITFDETVRRIVILLEISFDTYVYDGFRNLNRLRNSLTHDEINLNKEQVEQIVVSLLPMVMEICRNHLSEDERKQFNYFADSIEHEEILKGLYADNFRWRIITITNLLKLYSKIEYDKLTQAQMRNMIKTISALGIYVENSDLILSIDGEYYITIISYLKQEICDLLLRSKEDRLKSREISEIITKNETVKVVLDEYTKNAANYIYELITESNKIDNEFFNNSQSIDNFFKNSLLINKIDIFQLLYCMKRIVDVYVIVMEEKRRDDVLKRLYIDNEKNVSLQVFYSSLISWYSNNNWYNKVNMNELSDVEKEIFVERCYDINTDANAGDNAYNKFINDVGSRIYQQELYQEFIGEMGEWGTIDSIEYAEIVTLVKEKSEYIVVLLVSFGVQTYFDHECLDNGSKDAYISIRGNINNNGEFIISDAEYIGKLIGFQSFRFN